MIYKYLIVIPVILSITYLYGCSSCPKESHKTQSGKYYNNNLKGLLYIRNKWVNRIKRRDLKALKVISKADFYTLANRLGGESLHDVPMIPPTFKVFAETELTAIIIGMLENKEESTRKACTGFLKRFLDRSDIGAATKRKIKKSFREGRRRKKIGDTPRGYHRYRELTVIDESD